MNTTTALPPLAVRAIAEGALDGDPALAQVLAARTPAATLTGSAALLGALRAHTRGPVPLPLLRTAAGWLLSVEDRHGDRWAPAGRARSWQALERLTPGHVWSYAGDLERMDANDADDIRDRVLTALRTDGAVA